jgi:hypothetical protein
VDIVLAGALCGGAVAVVGEELLGVAPAAVVVWVPFCAWVPVALEQPANATVAANAPDACDHLASHVVPSR